ncbi:hypothetical protein SteCoe_704 [Stentor coeruleus]|uniref:PX domain-containing protein n=1 Tax=Stentor coeruleus TaxID=5963 RepID=A0A1R2D3M0_9CILI|nr:hypothetical protein SteCoe_704 [Stentor coeruleus]
MNENIILYAIFDLIPAWYSLYSLNRIRRHWRDGKEHIPRIFPKVLILKFLIALAISLFTIVQTISIMSQSLVVKIFFITFSVSWIISSIMLIFEFTQKLVMRWAGHRGFWILSFIEWSLLTFLNLEYHMTSFMKDIFIPRITLFCICTGLNFVLAIFAITKPNEFHVSPTRIDKPLMRSTRNSIVIIQSFFDKFSIKIRDYKIKNTEFASVIVYNTCVEIEGVVHVVKKTYKDFQQLDNLIKMIFPEKNFPRIEIPVLPNFFLGRMTTEEKMDQMNLYLAKICCVDFFNEDTLDFFEIEGFNREKILKLRNDVMEAADVLKFVDSGETGFIDLSLINHEQAGRSFAEYLSTKTIRSLKFVEVKVTLNIENDDRVSYSILSQCSLGERQIKKSFKDFLNLHKDLKKKISLEILPKLPKKSYFKLVSKMDLKALEIKKKKLEKYLIYLLNDPAFHAFELFEFIGYTKNLKELWSFKGVTYEIVPPIEWETDISEMESILFIITVKKIISENHSYTWQTKRTYKSFEYLNKLLIKRLQSPYLKDFYKYLNIEIPVSWPIIPENTIGLNSSLEKVCSDLENFMDKILKTPLIEEAYALTTFLNDI